MFRNGIIYYRSYWLYVVSEYLKCRYVIEKLDFKFCLILIISYMWLVFIITDSIVLESKE